MFEMLKNNRADSVFKNTSYSNNAQTKWVHQEYIEKVQLSESGEIFGSNKSFYKV
jgi:hypothetical protein